MITTGIAFKKCLGNGWNLEEDYYLAVKSLDQLDNPETIVRLGKKKSVGDKARLDGRKGPLGKVLYANKDFCIAEFVYDKVDKYLKAKIK